MHIALQVIVFFVLSLITSWTITSVVSLGLEVLYPHGKYSLQSIILMSQCVPADNLSWSVPVRDPVALYLHDSIHYAVDTEDGAMEFAQLLPAGSHLVHLRDGSEIATYTVSMFHQLRCLDIIRDAYVSTSAPPSLSVPTQHCLNYLRQMSLCRPRLQLESGKDGYGKRDVATRPYDAVCHDWTALYEAAEDNHQRYASGVSRLNISTALS